MVAKIKLEVAALKNGVAVEQELNNDSIMRIERRLKELSMFRPPITISHTVNDNDSYAENNPEQHVVFREIPGNGCKR